MKIRNSQIAALAILISALVLGLGYVVRAATSGTVTVRFVGEGGGLIAGGTLTLEAIAPAGYRFDHWEGDVDPAHPTDNPLSITMDGDRHVKAVFHAEPKEFKQLAIEALSALLLTGDKKTDDRIEKAIEHIEKSLNIDPKHPDKPWKKHSLWADDNHLDPKHGSKVFNEEKKAVKELKHLMDKKDTPQSVKDVCQSVIDKLIEADDILAHIAYEEAQDGAGDPKVDKELEKADEEFEKAQKELDHTKKHGTPDPDYDKAIKHYKNAWKHAQKALGHMPEDDEPGESE